MGGGNSLKPSHNQDFSLIEVFNNLALWGEKKFVSEQERTYKFQRGVYCHTEDNSPKYRMVCNGVGLESQTHRSFKFWYRDFCSSLRAIAKQSRETVITRSDKRRSNLILLIPHLEIKDFGPPASGGHGSYHCLTNVVNRLRNKCAMTSVGDMKENNFFDKVHSLFTTHHSLKRAGATHVALCDSVGSYFRHWCGAFTLAEVLVTLGIIGVVSAMTVPTLMQNYQRQSYVTQLHKVYNELSQALVRYQNDRNAINLTEAGLTSDAAFVSFINTYFKKAKECDTMNSCFATSYRKLSGATMGSYDPNYRSFVLASGATIRTGGYDPVGTKLFNIGVDVNGLKGPNIVGRDFFWIYIYNNGMIDDEPIDANTTAPFTAAQRETQFQNKCSSSGNNHGGGCFGKILNDNWQMNY